MKKVPVRELVPPNRTKLKWIDPKDRLPKFEKVTDGDYSHECSVDEVLFVTVHDSVHKGRIRRNFSDDKSGNIYWYYEGNHEFMSGKDVKYWMPLPKPPRAISAEKTT